ncbi:MAG: hypothetical protein WEB87_02580 [Bacteriovoracaceae bacterium]
MKTILALIYLFTVSCNQPEGRKPSSLTFEGFLHANSCMQGASYVMYNDKTYKLGSKSVSEVGSLIEASSQKNLSRAPTAVSGCEKIYKMRFNGEFEKESSMTGYGNDEIDLVVQIYHFQLI